MNPIKCILIDDEHHSIKIITEYLNQISNIQIEAIFEKPLDALLYILKQPIDLVITDLNMPQMNGIQLFESTPNHLGIEFIFVSGYSDNLLESLKFPAADYLQKPFSFGRFSCAIQKVQRLISLKNRQNTIYNKEYFIDDSLLNKLSFSERKILKLISQGKTSKEISEILFISEGTVSVHRHNIRDKLKIPINIELKFWAINFVSEIDRL